MTHYGVDTSTAVPISDRAYWIGAFDPSLRSFDIILKTANGTSYNSYLVKGDAGVAIIDTVKKSFQDTFFQRLESVCDYEDIRLIVLNHLEPDHTGALPELLRRAPWAKVYLSPQAKGMVGPLLHNVGDGLDMTLTRTDDRVELGGATLRFLNTPYLHWPDTQCTFLEEEKILFSGDLMGCHFCDDRLFNDLVGDFRFSFQYYYAHIMRPFKSYVRDALSLIVPLQPLMIAPAHGPVLREHPKHYIRHYEQMSAPSLASEVGSEEKTALVFYISAYGSTEEMARAIAGGMEAYGGVRVSLYDLEGGEVEPFVDLIEEADVLVLGSPTINGDAAKPIWDLLSSLAVIDTKGKIGGAFGSYGWTGEAVNMIEDRLRGLKLRVPEGGVKVKLIPNQAQLTDCEAFGRSLAAFATGTMEARTIDFSELV